MVVTNHMIIPQGSVNAVPFNVDSSWNRTMGSVAITAAAPASSQDELVALTTASATITIRAADYAALLGLSGAYIGYLLAKAEAAGVAFSTLMNSTARTSSN